MENALATRIYDFLKAYPPFDSISKNDLMPIAAQAVVRYCQPQEIVIHQGETLQSFIYMVREGAVQLYQEINGEKILVEKCDEGDLFGIQPLISKEFYHLNAIATEESLIYALPVELLHQLAEQQPDLAFYLASNYIDEVHPKIRKKRPPLKTLLNAKPSLVEVQRFEQRRAPVTCLPNQTIREAAEKMTQEEVGSIIIVNEKNFPIGIITDKDLRKQVATGKTALAAFITQIMSSPVITITPNPAIADVQIQMIKNRVHHLCITKDGTDQSPVLGVLSEHDLLVVQANNPAVLIRNIRRSQNIEALRGIREKTETLLRKYIDQEVSIVYISSIITEINDALTRRVIELCEQAMLDEGFTKPNTSFCWLSLGSAGREEQLLRTDQDNALVFANVSPDDYEVVKNYYLHLAGKVTTMLNKCDFEYCPANMMASNPQWCLSLDEWKTQFSEWIQTPTTQAVLYTTIFFDYRGVYGDITLSKALTDHIFIELERQVIFFQFLGKDALQNPPPLTFFRNFMVEKSGEHEHEFDIKSRAMMPLCDAARVLVLNAHIGEITNTFQRFEKLTEIEPSNQELYAQAAEAYEILMRYRTLEGLRHGNSGRYFKPGELSKMQRIHLRNCFKPIRELQSLLNVRFQLAFIR